MHNVKVTYDLELKNFMTSRFQQRYLSNISHETLFKNRYLNLLSTIFKREMFFLVISNGVY